MVTLSICYNQYMEGCTLKLDTY